MAKRGSAVFPDFHFLFMWSRGLISITQGSICSRCDPLSAVSIDSDRLIMSRYYCSWSSSQSESTVGLKGQNMSKFYKTITRVEKVTFPFWVLLIELWNVGLMNFPPVYDFLRSPWPLRRHLTRMSSSVHRGISKLTVHLFFFTGKFVEQHRHTHTHTERGSDVATGRGGVWIDDKHESRIEG